MSRCKLGGRPLSHVRFKALSKRFRVPPSVFVQQKSFPHEIVGFRSIAFAPFRLVVISALHNGSRVIRVLVDEAVFPVDTARPITGPVMP